MKDFPNFLLHYVENIAVDESSARRNALSHYPSILDVRVYNTGNFSSKQVIDMLMLNYLFNIKW